jgi:hypothetical protein
LTNRTILSAPYRAEFANSNTLTLGPIPAEGPEEQYQAYHGGRDAAEDVPHRTPGKMPQERIAQVVGQGMGGSHAEHDEHDSETQKDQSNDACGIHDLTHRPMRSLVMDPISPKASSAKTITAMMTTTFSTPFMALLMGM